MLREIVRGFFKKIRFQLVAEVDVIEFMNPVLRGRVTYPYSFWENGFGARRVVVDADRLRPDAWEMRSWLNEPFYDSTATAWKSRDITTDELQKTIDLVKKRQEL